MNFVSRISDRQILVSRYSSEFACHVETRFVFWIRVQGVGRCEAACQRTEKRSEFSIDATDQFVGKRCIIMRHLVACGARLFSRGCLRHRGDNTHTSTAEITEN
jgi:hypothetical protein